MPVPLKKYIDEAIASLKERTGSSKVAILKALYAAHPDLNESQTPAHLNSKVLRILKDGVKSGHYVAIKSSYKLAKKKPVKKVTAPKARKVSNRQELLNQVKDVYERFLHSCLDWVGGDDSLEFGVTRSLVEGKSWTDANEGDELLIIRRRDGGVFDQSDLTAFTELRLDVIARLRTACQGWKDLTGETVLPEGEYQHYGVPLLHPPLPEYWTEASDGDVVRGALGCRVFPGNYIPRRWKANWKKLLAAGDADIKELLQELKRKK